MSTKVPTADMIELESLFGPLFDEYFNGENQVVSKSSAVTTADASDKRQQQPDSASSSNDCHYWRKLRLVNIVVVVKVRLYSGGGIPFQLKSDSLPHAHAQNLREHVIDLCGPGLKLSCSSYVPSSENHLLCLTKENYVPWSSGLLRQMQTREVPIPGNVS
ncbi:hypothetical protein Tco_0089206 [Tanacetum coccineum]